MIRMWTLMIVMTIHGLAAAQEARPLAENPQAEARLKALAVELRCLVCQNQTLADSNAPLAKKKDFDKYLREKALPQVRELLTNYGPISTFWFDWPMGMTLERCQWFSDMARSLQPDMLINSRLGDKLVWPGPSVDYPSMGDDEIPDAKVSGVWESAGTMNTSNGHVGIQPV